MLRVNSSDVLGVPPFACAWIEKALLKDSAGCITFEAQGERSLYGASIAEHYFRRSTARTMNWFDARFLMSRSTEQFWRERLIEL